MFSVCAFAAEESFSWRDRDEAKIDRLIASAKDERTIVSYVAFKALIKVDDTTYAEFKSIINNAIKSKITDPEKIKRYSDSFIPQFASQIKRFRKFVPDVYKEYGLENGYVSRFYFAMNNEFAFKTFGSKIYCDHFVIAMENNVDSPYRLGLNVDRFSKKLVYLDSKDAIQALKKVKVMLYPNLGNEKIKPTIVKIELMLKSLE